MERLTERFENGQAAVLGCGNNCKYDYKYCNNYLEDCPTIGEIYEKLAAYEDAEEQGRILPAPLDDVERFSLDGGKTIWQRVYEADMPEGGTTVNENEAIEVLKDFDKQVTAKADGAYQSTVGKMACDTAIKALEEVQQYRTIGTVEELQDMKNSFFEALSDWRKYRKIGTLEECRAAMEKQNVNKELESHDEKHILECCISLMQEMVNEFAKWYRWQHGEDAIKELDEEERFCFRKSYFSIVQELFLLCTNHSGGTSTRAKCEQLGVDSAEKIEFDWSDEG